MLEIGTQVIHSGHGEGTIVAYNTTENDEYTMEHLNMVPNALMGAALGMFYNGDRYPYVILFDNGYQDVYGDHEVEIVTN
jgi:hypothetical protein